MTEPPTLANPIYRGETCRACKAPLVFVRTPKSKREPLERDPYALDGIDPALNAAARVVAIVDGEPQSLSLKAALELGVRDVASVYVSHFATCPERDRFRRYG